MIAALFVETGGAYFGLPGVDPWDEPRDARTYRGPWRVVAHPPCNRWCQLAAVNHKRYGTPIGEDGGCFESALRSVRLFGGVLEHPAYTIAWKAYGLPKPIRGAWTRDLCDGGWVTEISQVAYGHPARKRTWLYYVGPTPPNLDWSEPSAWGVVGAGVNSGESAGRPRVERDVRTPPAFRELLLSLAEAA